MAENQYTFNKDAYLLANPDIAADGYYSLNPFEHFQNFGQREGRQAKYDATPQASDPSQWQEYGGYTNSGWGMEDKPKTYQDPSTGNVYSRTYNPDFYEGYGNNIADNYTMLGSGNALNDRYIGGLGLSAEESEKLYQQSLKDPAGSIKDLTKRYSDIWYDNYGQNENSRNISYVDPILIDLKQKDPASYYENKIENYGRQMGWQLGQGTPERNAAIQAEMQKMIPEALQSGVSIDKLNSLINGGVQQASQDNQQRIANQKQEGNFYTESLIGTAKVGLMALGAYGLDTALAAGLSSGAGGGFGLTGASGAGGSMGTASALQLAPTVGASTGFGLSGGTLATGLGVGSGGVLGAGALSAEAVATLEALSQGAGYGLNASQVGNLAEGLSLTDLTSKGMSVKDALEYTNKAKKMADALMGKSSPAAMGGGGGSSGSNSLLAALSAKQIKANENPFGKDQPIMTIVDPDAENRENPNSFNYGLANLLRSGTTYG